VLFTVSHTFIEKLNSFHYVIYLKIKFINIRWHSSNNNKNFECTLNVIKCEHCYTCSSLYFKSVYSMNKHNHVT